MWWPNTDYYFSFQAVTKMANCDAAKFNMQYSLKHVLISMDSIDIINKITKFSAQSNLFFGGKCEWERGSFQARQPKKCKMTSSLIFVIKAIPPTRKGV
jgi:hypothetical protein